jgi:hypothetical protein
MSAGKAKRMLVHVKENEEWNTFEFFSIADTKRYLRGNGVRFRDENAFSPEYGIIIDTEKLIEIEEACVQEEELHLFDKTYISLGEWCRRNEIDYKSGVAMVASRRLDAVKVGRKGRIYVSEKFVSIPYKDKPIISGGITYIPLSIWAERNGVDYNKAHYLCNKGVLNHIRVPKKKLSKIYIDEREALDGKK